MNPSSGLHWYLVYCKPRQEETARRNLRRQGFAVYLPLIREMKRRAGKRAEVISPMFPRYLFIRLSTERDNWGPIRSTLGVVSLVRFGNTPSPVPDSLIETIRQREDADGVQTLPGKEYKRGEPVRITEGGFAGYQGIFLARTARDRVTVLLDVLGRETPTQVSSHVIEPAD